MQSIFQVGKCLSFITWMFLRIFFCLWRCVGILDPVFWGFFKSPTPTPTAQDQKNKKQRLWRSPELMPLKPTLTLTVNPGMVA